MRKFLLVLSLLFSFSSYLENIPDFCQKFLFKNNELKTQAVAKKLYAEALVLAFNNNQEEALDKSACSLKFYNGQEKWDVDGPSILAFIRSF